MSEVFLKKKIPNSPLSIVKMSVDVLKSCKKYLVLFTSIVIMTIVLVYAKHDASALTTSTYTYAISLIIPILFAFLYTQNIAPFGDDPNINMVFYGFFGACAFALGLYYLYTKILSSTALIMVNGIMNIIVICMILLAVVIFYNVFVNAIHRMENGKYGIIFQLLFYIPCLANDFIIYLIGEYKSTPTVVFYLFIIELLLILLYIYAPFLIRKVVSSSAGTILLNAPVFLDSETFIASSDDLKSKIPVSVGITDNPELNTKSYIATEIQYLTNYSISMWVFINPQLSSSAKYSNESVIFKYGHTSSDKNICAKPMLTYSSHDNAYYVYCTDVDSKYFNNSHYNSESGKYKIDLLTLPSQRWNNFVFNYTENSTDLFINGYLERSFPLNDRFPTYTADDMITIGEKDGLFGAICNIQFHTKVMNKSDIIGTFNVFRSLNPPVINNSS